jgi:hypothetical protein
MGEDLSTLGRDSLARWRRAANSAGIPEEAYSPTVKIVRDKSGKSNYTFAVMLNSYRFKRYKLDESVCPLCEEVQIVGSELIKNLDPDSRLENFIVTPNKFPISEGASIAIDKGILDRERPMYTTKNLDGLADELEKVFAFGNETGFRAHHNGEGAGATIPRHEHWHLINPGGIYELAGEKFGLGDAYIEPLCGDNRIFEMPGFPFAHIGFSQNDPERIVSFLRNLGLGIGDRYPNGAVPHTISHEQEKGVLVVPFKKFEKRGIGSGDIAGNVICHSGEEFETIDYNYCINGFGKVLFANSEIDLQRFL